MRTIFVWALVALVGSIFVPAAEVNAQGIQFQNPTTFEQFGLSLNLQQFNRQTESCGTPTASGKPEYIFHSHGKKEIPNTIVLWCSISKQHIQTEKFAMLIIELQKEAKLQDAREFAMTYTSGVYNPVTGTHFSVSMSNENCLSSSIFVAMQSENVEMHKCSFTVNGSKRVMVDVPLVTAYGRKVVAIIYNYDRYFPIAEDALLNEVRRIMGSNTTS